MESGETNNAWARRRTVAAKRDTAQMAERFQTQGWSPPTVSFPPTRRSLIELSRPDRYQAQPGPGGRCSRSTFLNSNTPDAPVAMRTVGNSDLESSLHFAGRRGWLHS